MTFSILARDPETGAFGCAAATGNLAVGAWVLRAAPDGGAVATQGHAVSPLWGDDCLALLRQGKSAAQAVDAVVNPDSGREHRQLSALDREAGTAAWTGSQNSAAKGHLQDDGYVIAGNWLTSVNVLKEMERAFQRSLAENKLTFAERLLAAINAGISAGSDARGTMSAALQVVSRNSPPLDLRVDYDEDPLSKLRSLLVRATSEPYVSWIEAVPTLDNPHRY